jgi:hypothetical protein
MKNVITKELLIALTAAATLAACGGGGGGSSPPPSSSPPPTTTPPPPPPAPAPPPPSGGSVLPPLSATVQDITDNHRIGEPHFSDPQTDGAAIGSYTCVVNPPQTYHVHSHLSIIQNNEVFAVPQYIGAAQSGNTHCFYPIHTHDQSGKIHVESTAPGTFTLGNLFEIWQQPLTDSNVLGISGLPIEIFVTDNGTVTKVEAADWKNIELKDHREVTISLGTEVTEIPNVTWND